MLTRQAKNNLGIQHLDFCSVEDDMQTGFFHSTSIPVLGFLITRLAVNDNPPPS